MIEPLITDNDDERDQTGGLVAVAVCSIVGICTVLGGLGYLVWLAVFA